jgi:hypothetical protein
MHLKDDVLHAFLDHELDQEVQKHTNEHLASCSTCTSRLKGLQMQGKLAKEKLDLLAPDASVAFSPHQALEKHLTRSKEQNKMKNWLKHPAWIAASLVVIMAVSLIFPPVRALASDLLGLFRVEQVKVISFDPALLQQMDGMQGNEDQMKQFMEKNIIAVQDGEFTQVDQLDQAADLAGFTPRLPGQSELVSLGVMGTSQYEIKIDAALWNSILQGLGQESALISTELDGEVISVLVPAAVTAGLGDCGEMTQENDLTPTELGDCIVLVEMPSPEVSMPDGLDVPKLAEAMLQLTGMSPDEARAFSQSVDWATTLVLPIPSGEGVSSRDIAVDGVTGTLVTDTENDAYTLFWVRRGMLYGITGSGDPQNAVDLANTLIR